MNKYNLNNQDVKNIIKRLSIDDFIGYPEFDRDKDFEGFIFKFKYLYENIDLYIKIRLEKIENVVCISIHEFGKYKE